MLFSLSTPVVRRHSIPGYLPHPGSEMHELYSPAGACRAAPKVETPSPLALRACVPIAKTSMRLEGNLENATHQLFQRYHPEQ